MADNPAKILTKRQFQYLDYIRLTAIDDRIRFVNCMTDKTDLRNACADLHKVQTTLVLAASKQDVLEWCYYSRLYHIEILCNNAMNTQVRKSASKHLKRIDKISKKLQLAHLK